MGLQDLNENLYERDFEKQKIDTRFEGQVDGSAKDFQSQAWAEKTTPSVEAVDDSLHKKRKWILIALGVVGMIALVASAFFVRKMLFSDTNVTLVLDGPKSVASAESVTFSLQYANDNWVALHSAEIAISYPKNFRPDTKEGWIVADTRIVVPVGDIASRSTARVDVTGKFFGSKGESSYLDATLRYSPSQMSEIFSYDTRYGVVISTSPISLEMSAPKMAATGDTVEYLIDYENQGTEEFPNIRIKLEYPDSFQFTSADPVSSEGNTTWYVGDLAGKMRGKIRVSGILTGQRGEVKPVKASIGYFQGNGDFLSYSTISQLTRIDASPLSIDQLVNDSRIVTTTLGSMLTYRISYKNEGNIGFRDAIITLDFDTSILDFSRMQKQSGYFDAVKKQMIWQASDIPTLDVLDPGESGEIVFSVPVFTELSNISGKHLGIRTTAKIDSPDVPTPAGSNKIIASSALNVQLSSAIDLTVKGRYYGASVENSGPIPPKVGVQTTYGLTFKLTNSLNDLSGARVVASLPSGVRFTGKFSPESETVTFNDRTNELVWEIGNFSAGSQEASREVTVQVAVIPGPSDVDKEIRLMNRAIFFAKDTFTGGEVKKEQGEKTTALPEDTKMTSSGYQVKK
jgi:hypothetical protein